MEADLDVRCECKDTAQRDLFVRFLAKDTRPLLEDEVTPEERECFLVIDDIEYPHWLRPHGDKSLQASWQLEPYSDDAMDMLNDLVRAGAVNVQACITYDGMFDSVRFFRADKAGIQAVEAVDMDTLEEKLFGEDGESDDDEARFNAVIFSLLDEMAARA